MGETPRSAMFDDVYFSAVDGPAETEHVFLNGNNLPAAWQGKRRFTIGETGFGTGLNFLLAWELFDRTAQEGAFLDFVSVEKYPLSVEEIRNGLSPWAARLEPYLEKMLAQYPLRVSGFHRIVFDRRVALTLIFDDANDALPEMEGEVDAWFLDGFTPSKNPDMWTQKLFDEMARLSHRGTSFATFTAAGFVKRGLREAGFTVEKRQGFGPKRDMLAGRFENGLAAGAVASPSDDIHILGAGLAGCSCASVLKQYGFSPILHDPNGIASGASGNPVGIVNPRLSAYRSAESDFFTAGFAQTVRNFPAMGADYKRCGALHLAIDEEKALRLERAAVNWGWGEHMRYLSAEEASDAGGVPLGHKALYLPDASRINPRALCQSYADGIPLRSGPAPRDGIHILANGIAAGENLPIHTVRGQITQVRATPQSAAIKVNIGYGGYISAANQGIHTVGATFQKWMADTNERDEDDAANLENLAKHIPSLGVFEIAGHRAALRIASQDRFPVIGKWGDNYISTAHGSHGLVSTIAGAHLIADLLRGGIRSLGKSTINRLSPQRFSERQLRKSAKKV